MSLMDAYGLSLVSGTICGALLGTFKFRYCWWISCCRRLGESPLRTLFLANTIMWIIVQFSSRFRHPSYYSDRVIHLLVPNSSSQTSEQTIIRHSA